MPDWHALIRQRLSGLRLNAPEREEVHAELADHLEESYAAFRTQGLPEKEAARRTVHQVSDWQDLQHKIFVAKKGEHPMQKRLQQLWIPAFLTLILSMLSLVALQSQGLNPRLLSSGPGTVLFHAPWLISLLFVGALGAHLSARANASRATVLLASVVPVLALTLAFLLMFPIGWVFGRINVEASGFAYVATMILRDTMGWLILPGVALLLGGLLVQLLIHRRASPTHTVIG